jgi:chromate transporter
MVLAAYGLNFADGRAAQGLIHGLKVLAVAVVAQAVWSMGRRLCPDASRASFALMIAALLIAVPSAATQFGAIAAGALFGLLTLRPEPGASREALMACGASRSTAVSALILFLLLLFGLPVLASVDSSGTARLAEAFYRAGALVFGGGHVVLPLLQEATVTTGFVPRDAFLAGYGLAQALPGPLFTFAAFLGFQSSAGPGGLTGAALALAMIFLPGFLLIYGALPFWDGLRRNVRTRAALAGINAAVVGILGAALYHPIWTASVTGPRDAVLALILFALFAVLRWPMLTVVMAASVAGIAFAMIS